jgi:hypothetical protein
LYYTSAPVYFISVDDSFGFDDEDAKIVLKRDVLDPPRKLRRWERPPYVPPPPMDPEKLRALVQRAREIGPRLTKAIEDLNDAIERRGSSRRLLAEKPPDASS